MSLTESHDSCQRMLARHKDSNLVGENGGEEATWVGHSMGSEGEGQGRVGLAVLFSFPLFRTVHAEYGIEMLASFLMEEVSTTTIMCLAYLINSDDEEGPWKKYIPTECIQVNSGK